MRKGQSVVNYEGESLSLTELVGRYGEATAPYALEVTADCFIDCALRRGIGAYINAARQKNGIKTSPANVRFVVHTARRTARFVTIRRIRAGQEILVAYGGEYWRDPTRCAYSTSEFPAWEWDPSDPFTALASGASSRAAQGDTPDPSYMAAALATCFFPTITYYT
jgi:hypothetical protein